MLTDYPSEGGIPLQTGTLKAWVVYTAGDHTAGQ
jgi:hypothetical protein